MTDRKKIDNDQYYTMPDDARFILNKVPELIATIGTLSDGNIVFVEPSAGSGVFPLESSYSLDSWRMFDLDPHPSNELIEKWRKYNDDESNPIIKADFLSTGLNDMNANDNHCVFIGNPPFGRRSALAISFVNHALSMSNLVIMVLPIQFDKYLTQKQIDGSASLIWRSDLPSSDFISPDGNLIKGIRCAAYAWARGSNLPDLREHAPITAHRDFEMWQYNNTRQAEKYFDHEKYPWDFAVLRQGYGDYKTLKYPGDDFDKHKQWIFIHAHDENILNTLKSIDYEKLSRHNTSVPGFGKADVINEYIKTTNREPQDEGLFD